LQGQGTESLVGFKGKALNIGGIFYES